MVAILLSVIAWSAGAYKIYDSLPAWMHGLADFAAGFIVGYIYLRIHGPIL